MNHAHGWISGWSTALWLVVMVGGLIVGSLIVLALRRQAKRSRR